MDIDRFLKDKFYKALVRLFDLDKYKFEEVIIKQHVIDAIIDLARDCHPKESLSFLDGNIKDKKLIIDGLTYQEYDASTSSAAPIFRFPDLTFYGSAHSHPGYSNRPSNADREFFRKVGIVNIIICMPYNKDSMAFYDHDGNKIKVQIEE